MDHKRWVCTSHGTCAQGPRARSVPQPILGNTTLASSDILKVIAQMTDEAAVLLVFHNFWLCECEGNNYCSNKKNYQ